jgi:hypothetical protein
MTRYMLSVQTGSGEAREPKTAEHMRRGFEQIEILEADMRSHDALVFSGRLGDPDQARVVAPGKTRVRMTDGPYAETKEHLGGFYIIDAQDMNAALGWAAKVTVVVGAPIEVREFADYAPR